MIICCPGCQKRYDVTSHIITQKEHYKLRCSHCHTLWHLSSVLPEPQPVTASPEALQANSKPYFPSQKSQKPVASLKTYSTWHDVIKRYSLDWILLLVAVAFVILLVVYEGKYIRELIQGYWGAPTPIVLPQPLRIESVAFSTIEQKGQLGFVVKGDIVNPSNTVVASPDLQIIARGDCPPNSTESNPSRAKSQQCILIRWVHPMGGHLIQARQRQSFQAFAPTQGTIRAKEVEITGYLSPQQRKS